MSLSTSLLMIELLAMLDNIEVGALSGFEHLAHIRKLAHASARRGDITVSEWQQVVAKTSEKENSVAASKHSAAKSNP